jgi:hypothetical protein
LEYGTSSYLSINFPPHTFFRDTVQSVGLVPKHLPFSGSNNAIVHFRHALSLDEHRVKFIPFFCTGKPKRDATDSKTSQPDDAASQNHRHKVERRQHSEGSQAEEYENHVNALTGPDSDVEEVFFAGAHCGTLRLFLAYEARYLRSPPQTLAVDLCRTVHVTVSPASPFDG